MKTSFMEYPKMTLPHLTLLSRMDLFPVLQSTSHHLAVDLHPRSKSTNYHDSIYFVQTAAEARKDMGSAQAILLLLNHLIESTVTRTNPMHLSTTILAEPVR